MRARAFHYKLEDGKYRIKTQLRDGRVVVIASAELVSKENPTGIIQFDTEEEAERYCQGCEIARDLRARIIAVADSTS